MTTLATVAFGVKRNAKVRPEKPSPLTSTVVGTVPSSNVIEICAGTKHGGCVVDVVVEVLVVVELVDVVAVPDVGVVTVALVGRVVSVVSTPDEDDTEADDELSPELDEPVDALDSLGATEPFGSVVVDDPPATTTGGRRPVNRTESDDATDVPRSRVARSATRTAKRATTTTIVVTRTRRLARGGPASKPSVTGTTFSRRHPW